MKTIRIVILTFLSVVALTGICQKIQAPVPQDPILTFKVPLSKVQTMVYAIRYSQVMDAKSANELADLLVNQANDTVLNKPVVSQSPPPAPAKTESKGKRP